MIPSPPSLARLPFVGRTEDLAWLRARMEQARAARGGTVFVTGEGGAGKSRMVGLLAEEARRQGWTVAAGRAYSVEVGVPYALFSDALVPALRELGREKLQALTRGAEAELEVLLPLLRAGGPVAGAPVRTADANLQLYWTFAQFLKAWSQRAPLLIALDDLHWADASSLELLHFVARHLAGGCILIVATVNDAERSQHMTLLGVEQSLHGLGAAAVHQLKPLTRTDTDELVRVAFGTGETVTREFSALLFGWTRGNPFFIEETLKTLVDAGRLRWENNRWLGWEMEALDLPGSIRDAVLLRLARLSTGAREIAEVVAVIGTRSRYETLRSVCSLDELKLVEALEELRRRNLLTEGVGDRGPVYEFEHPMVRKIVLGEMGLARQRLLHGRIAAVLESAYGANAGEHAEELALHFARSAGGAGGAKAVRYLAAAGRSALGRYANREAADHLSAALERLDTGDDELAPTSTEPAVDRFTLMKHLARARQRLGEFEQAIALWGEASADAERRGDAVGVASMQHRIGLSHFWAGRHAEAIAALDLALPLAAADPLLTGRIRMARGVSLNMLGRAAAAHAELDAVLKAAEKSGDPDLLTRVCRVLMLFHTWSGAPDEARRYGQKALALAEQAGALPVACSCHWAMAVVAGLTGRSAECGHHLEAGTRLATDLRSPLLRLAFDEIAIQYVASIGRWDDGIAIGEKAIALARGLNQKTVLPRLLVWTGMIYLGRHDLDRARGYFQEAWALSGADDPEQARDMHSVIPAHIGMASYHLVVEELDDAVQIAQAGVALADRTGYTIWAVHRLLAVLGEALLRKRDLDGARTVGTRLRREAEPIGHVLGIAWADACDAVLAWLGGDVQAGAIMLRRSADALDAIPFVPDGARIRRQLAGRLADLGDRDGALRELRRVHDVFLALGAEDELRRTRLQFHEIEARPPSKQSAPGVQGLTGREVEIIRLIATRKSKSNKAIGQTLGISARTVTTHLSNIYQKLHISSRGELADLAPNLLSADR